MTTWEKEDRAAFEGSEVMAELEKRLTRNIITAANIIKKSQEGSQGASDKLQNLSNQTKETSGHIKELKNEMSSLSDDGEAEDEEGEEDEDMKVKEAILSDLEDLKKIALDSKNFSDLYKIERTMQEVLDEE